MRYIIIFFGFLIFSTIFISCKKDNITIFDCTILQEGLKSDNPDLVKKEINKICGTLSASTTKENLQKLTTIISSKCKMEAIILCSECIYTDPPQSEIKISYSISGIQSSKTIDILSTKPLQFAGMHD